ncbi:MAG: FAD-dependent oxidoreductase [Terrisporobacter othiniensis]|uniref:NAD(P)/FAD-dependent oxidoreductase n=1 Tax=Terrisporobacter petrolearius TaxID=1460447 RepID=UPI0022E1CA9D|nr:FAD-dependent oxidoreductase [Terrisporobacter petrolearius]MDU4862592.1 FAD-dependent oxidoreductase [Terrisporobacter othiniensis]MDU6996290.1 FAD-dependent oxidoreductase [Terrisporobacter othiniensis]
MPLENVHGTPMFTKNSKIKKQYEYLTEDLDTEVIIVGGGVTGSIVGYYFSKANIPAVILEKERVAHCSTSITTSLLQYELDSNARQLEEYTTLDNVIMSYKLGLKALDEIDEFIKEYGNKCKYQRKDTLLYTSKDEEIKEMKEEYEIRKKAGIDVKYISKEDNPFSINLKGGVYGVNGGAQLDPYEYTHELLDVSCNMGLKVYENTEVIDIKYLGNSVEVITSYGYKVKGKKVIVATGYNTERFTKRNFGHKTVTYNIVTKPVDRFDGWFNKVLIRDNCDPYNYFRTTEDNRIIAGGEDIDFYNNILNEKVAKEKYEILLNRIKNMFPKINSIESEYEYCGGFISSQDNLGFFGEDPNHKNLWYCLGYGANGILFAILGGMMLSKFYKGEIDDNMKLFKVDRFDK